MIRHHPKLYNQVVNFEVLPGDTPRGGSLEVPFPSYIWQDTVPGPVHRGESGHMAESFIYYDANTEHIEDFIFVVWCGF